MDNKIDNIMPVILTGGKSSRMGYNKSLATLGGKRMIEQVADKIADLFAAPPLLVTNTPDEYAFMGLPMTGDIITGAGPLGGIHAALRYTRLRHIFVFACDMPLISRELVRTMAARSDGWDVVVPIGEQRLEPLCAIYSRRCLGAVEDTLARGDRRIIAFFSNVSVTYVDIETLGALTSPESFQNINTPDELAAIRARWSFLERGNRF